MTESHPCQAFIGLQIKYWRKKRNLTQVQLAEKADVKYRHYQDIEAGKVDLKMRTLGCISKALDLMPDELLKPVDDNTPFMCEECARYIKKHGTAKPIN